MRTDDRSWSSARVAASVVVLASAIACTEHAVRLETYTVDGYTLSSSERRLIQSIADDAVAEVRPLLPALPRDLVLRVQAGRDVIPETGETASALPPSAVRWIVDPQRPGGVEVIAKKHLRAVLFHELHHLVRGAAIESETLLDRVVSEGLATAFERDFARAETPWGDYPTDVEAWTEEVLALPADADRETWMHRHPDGRRWIGMKVGTYLVDRATRATGKTSAELVTMPTTDLIRLAR